jgi:anti-anti-sigma regulatory factor
MPLNVLTHPWDVQDLEHGPLVRITHQDLNVATISTLIDELIELVRESGQPNLSLDFAEVNVLPALVVGKLFALESKLQAAGGHLVLCNLTPAIKALLQPESTPPDFPCSSIGGRDESEDCFVVYVRDGLGATWRPGNMERPVAACSTYKEASRVRETIRQAGRSCVVRFIGDTGGGD